MRRSILAIFLVMIFLASSITISNDVETNTKNEKVVASITYSSNERSSTTFALQPIVVITQPEDGAVVTDPHLVVLGYASDESGMNYWEWEWRWAGGSKSNSSYFETAEYVEFRIDIYGLHSGWNLIIVRFKNIYGALGEDSVNVTYNPPNSPPNKPTKPEGPTEGKVKETLHFNTVTTDPDGDSLEYLIDWGDGTNTGWLGPITSGTPFQNFHAWDEPGTYEVKAKARDIPYLEESEWSEPLVVTISSEDDEPPVVVIEYPENGATFTEPVIQVTGTATDNVGVTQIGYTQQWEGGSTGSSWPLEEPTMYYPFDIEVELHEGENVITIEAGDVAGNYGYDEVIVTLEYCSIDLTIYDGLEGTGGGNVVPESEEETRGAFTVTNIQDTNGDGIRDRDQNPVKATPKGRDEVDLMKMVLNPPLGLECGPNSLVYLVKSGSNSGQVKLWDSPTKNNEIPPTNPPDTWVYKVSELPKTVWVEIREENPLNLVMRGITFTYSTDCCNKTDVVKATGIWSEVTEVKHDNSDAWNNAVWPDMPKNVREYIDEAGGFGLRRYQSNNDWWYGNVIAIEFTVYPPGIGNEKGIYFDITRQIHYVDRRFPRAAGWPDQENWPNQVEQPNDDTHNDDESDKPSAQNHMYSIDSPSFRESGWGNALFIDSSNNFVEFMRVRLDGTKPLGETVQGSRCSNYYYWHAALWLNRDWKNPGQVNRRQNREVHPINCVEPGHILILDFRPPW
ncbi:MAG TPA: hypothetical protein ENL29_00905 [Thermoplasmatales archaeon]|nr:hypothetical protein [Thermoplasmatales archaeon]